jgi:kynurenine formamidase
LSQVQLSCQAAKQDKQEYIGVRADEDAFRWFWNQHFAAVACDTMSFENWPPSGPDLLHERFLSFWGTPIGEIWNLEELARIAKSNNRWTFLLTSAPLHVPGGVASPPNVIAIF